MTEEEKLTNKTLRNNLNLAKKPLNKRIYLSLINEKHKLNEYIF